MNSSIFVPQLVRSAAGAALLAAGLGAAPARAADPAPFDLSGPGLRVTVTRDGVTLPIGQVPDLAEGDRLMIQAELPEDQRVRFVLVSAFLSGATNPPDRKWIATAETWKRKAKDRALSLTVPEGARQLVVFLVPETGGAADSIADTVRARPGEFVRASQAINQVSLDRARLDAFVAAVRAEQNAGPAQLKSVAPTLARSLSIKLNADCLAKLAESQAACLVENRESLVLPDMHGNSVARTLAGASTDLALQLSYTREAGLGYYSQYIAVARDIARLFGVFSSPQFRYLPAVSLRNGEHVSLLLNTPPSFAKPRSVLVASMPAIGSDSRPRLRAASSAPVCGADPGLVFPVDGAPLIYASEYARDMVLRVDGTDMALEARPERGGYTLRAPLAPGRFQGTIDGRLRGMWGYRPFEGPHFRLQFPGTDAWKAGQDGANLVVGRENKLLLTGQAPACVSRVTMRQGDAAPRQVTFAVEGDDGLALILPLERAQPGEMVIEIHQLGRAKPAVVSLQAYRQASSVTELLFHAGDRGAQLTGQRLDQVASVQLGGLRLRPDGLVRDGDVDRLRLTGVGAGPQRGDAVARVTLADGRILSLAVAVRPPRIRVELLDKSVTGADSATPHRLVTPETMLPDTARLTFSVRASNGAFSLRDSIEIEGTLGQALTLGMGRGLQLQGPDVLVATVDPASFGPTLFGPLRFRLVRDGEASDWQALITRVRLPKVTGIECGTAQACTLTGEALFLVDSVADTPAFDQPVAVPQGYTGHTLNVPVPNAGKLYLKLRDAPEQVVVLQAE